MIMGFRMVLTLANGDSCVGTGMGQRKGYTDLGIDNVLFHKLGDGLITSIHFFIMLCSCIWYRYSFVWLLNNKNLRKWCIAKVRYMKSNCTIK